MLLMVWHNESCVTIRIAMRGQLTVREDGGTSSHLLWCADHPEEHGAGKRLRSIAAGKGDHPGYWCSSPLCDISWAACALLLQQNCKGDFLLSVYTTQQTTVHVSTWRITFAKWTPVNFSGLSISHLVPFHTVYDCSFTLFVLCSKQRLC